jgi:methionyl aminopeptidase
MYTKIKTVEEIQAMRISGKILAEVLDYLSKRIDVNMSTLELNNIAAKELKSLGGEPAFLGYQGFPGILCVSINNEVVHGIPNKNKIINNGDIVSLDFGVIYDGMITDAAISLICGNKVNDQDKMLTNVTKKSLLDGVNQLHDNVRVGDISNAIEKTLVKNKLGVVRDLVGHGVGHELHEDPNIPNYGKKGTGPKLFKNMTIAIEPMATLGTHEVYLAEDGWTILTKDGSRAAHFEHTVLITETGAEILTLK